MKKLPEHLEEKKKLLESLVIENGEITEVEYCEGKSFRMVNGMRLRGHGPFFAVHLKLRPEAGSCIGITMGLPTEDWNGKFAGFGNGGAAGTTAVKDVCRGTALGYASAHTDMGTDPAVEGSVGNMAVVRDFGGRATHLMTMVGKQITTAFYGRAPEYSYFFGGSTGGQQGMKEAQEYPEDYNGIVCLCPAYDRIALHAQVVWELNRSHEAPFSKKELEAITARMVEEYGPRCGSAPGDNFIAYPMDIGAPDLSILRDEKMKVKLTDSQIAVLEKLYAGPSDPETGESIHVGMTPGTETQNGYITDLGELYAATCAALLFPFRWGLGNTMDPEHFDFHADYLRGRQQLSALLDAPDPDLSRFRALGGKMIMVHGTADSLVPHPTTLRYFEQLQQVCGDTADFLRLFVVPGHGHAMLGPAFQDVGYLDYAAIPQNALYDPLIALDEWVTQDKAPAEIIARGFVGNQILMAKVCRERPIYPWPTRTRYRSGDPDKKESYEPQI